MAIHRKNVRRNVTNAYFMPVISGETD
jgi:hypothetical protein